MNMRMIFGTMAAAVALAGCVSGPKVDNAPVATLDLNRYLGEWYEIARFDHSFERGVEQAKANYTQNADGTIRTPARLVLRPVLRRLPRDADRQGLLPRPRRQRQCGLSLDSLAHVWIV